MTEIKITKLQYPNNIRHHVSMYLGSTRDFSTPLREIIDNANDELLNDYATKVWIHDLNGQYCVTDNGRGLPVYVDVDHEDRIITHAAMTELHTGSKMSNPDEITGGVHGIGSSAVNAVSEKYCIAINLKKKDLKTTLAWIRKAGKKLDSPIMYIEYCRGVLVGERVIDGVSKLSDEWGGVWVPEDFSTSVFMVPDDTIFGSIKAQIADFPLKLIVSMKSANITVNGVEVEPFDFKTDIAKDHDLFLNDTIDFDFKINDYVSISGSLAYDLEDMYYSHKTLINLIENPHGGMIERKLHQALGRMLHNTNSIVKAKDSILGLMIFSHTSTALKMSFSSQTKERLVSLGNTNYDQVYNMLIDQGVKPDHAWDEAQKYHLPESLLKSKLDEGFKLLFDDNTKFFVALCDKIVEYHSQMKKLSNTDFIKSKVILGDEDRRRSMSGEMTKVYEATSTYSPERELYIVEGLSAASPIIKSRDLKTQSILPLRGKLINSASMDTGELVESPELLGIINTIGCGVGSLVDLEQARYGKIIIATDLDVDGRHIANLIIAVFLTHAPEMIKAGLIYKVEAPYYYDKTNELYYMADQKDEIDFNHNIEKRKGLGSYTTEEVDAFLVGKERHLIQVTYPEDDVVVSDAAALLYSGTARRDLMSNSGILVLPKAPI